MLIGLQRRQAGNDAGTPPRGKDEAGGTGGGLVMSMSTESRRTGLGAAGDAKGSGSTPAEVAVDRRAHWDARHAAHEPIELLEVEPSLDEEVAYLTPGRALDLGTGDGRNAVWLARQGWSVTGVDFSSVGLDRAQARARAEGVSVEWVLADLLEWRPPAVRFDLVVLFFIHVAPEDRRAIHRMAASAVAPGGTLLVVGHDRSNLVAGSGGPQNPAVLFTADEVASELPGLTVRRAEAVRRPVDDDRWRIDAVVRAVRPIG